MSKIAVCHNSSIESHIAALVVCNNQRAKQKDVHLFNIERSILELMYALDIDQYNHVWFIGNDVSVDALKTIGLEYPKVSATIICNNINSVNKYKSVASECGLNGFHLKVCTNKSLPKLCFDLFFASLAAPRIIDVFEGNFDAARYVRRYIGTLDLTLDTISNMSRILNNAVQFDEIVMLGREIDNHYNRAASDAAIKAQTMQLGGYIGAFACCDAKIRDLTALNVLSNDNQFALLLPIYDHSVRNSGYFDSKIEFFIKSRSDCLVDVLKLAKTFDYAARGVKNCATFSAKISDVLTDKQQLLILRGLL